MSLLHWWRWLWNIRSFSSFSDHFSPLFANPKLNTLSRGLSCSTYISKYLGSILIIIFFYFFFLLNRLISGLFQFLRTHPAGHNVPHWQVAGETYSADHLQANTEDPAELTISERSAYLIMQHIHSSVLIWVIYIGTVKQVSTHSSVYTRVLLSGLARAVCYSRACVGTWRSFYFIVWDASPAFSTELLSSAVQRGHRDL